MGGGGREEREQTRVSKILNFIWGQIQLSYTQTVKRLPTMRETQVQLLGREDPLEKEMVTHSSTLAWKIHRWRILVGYSPWGCKESDTTESSHMSHYIGQGR